MFTPLTAGEPPDFGVFHATRLLTYADVLLPLGDRLDYDEYVPAITDMVTIDDRQVAAPLDSHPMGFYYNKEIYEEAGHDPEDPPDNWDDFEQLNNDIVDAGYENAAFDPGTGTHAQRLWQVWTYSRGTDILAPTNGGWEPAFNDEDGLAMAEIWANIPEWGWCGYESDLSYENFVEGEHGAVWDGTWAYSRFREGGGEELDFDWGIYSPSVAPEKEADYTRANSHTIGVPQNPEKTDSEVDAAVTAVEWITQRQGKMTWATSAGRMPASQPVLESDELREDPVWDKTLSMFYGMAVNDQFYIPPQTEHHADLVEIVFNNMDAVRFQDKEPQEALDDMERQLCQVYDC